MKSPMDNQAWAGLFRRDLATESLQETQSFCAYYGLAEDAWLDAVWEDREGHRWSALSRLGYLRLCKPTASSASEETFTRALAHCVSQQGWPVTHPEEPDVVWAWLGALTQEISPPELMEAFKGAPAMAGVPSTCGTGTGPGWMTHAVNQLLWVAEDMLGTNGRVSAGVDCLVSSLTQGWLWQNHDQAMECPWGLGTKDPPKPHFDRVRRRNLWQRPGELGSDHAFSDVWGNLCKIHCAFAKKGLLYNAGFCSEHVSRTCLNKSLQRLTPVALQQGWQVVAAEAVGAQYGYSGLRPEARRLAEALCLISVPAGWGAPEWKRLHDQLKAGDTSERLSALVRERCLEWSLPAAPSPRSKPRF